jgi:hypothetical protein
MTRNPTPAATSQTKPNNQGGVTPVNVTPPRKVTYVFKTNSSSGLRIPYAVAVDNAVLVAFAERPRRVSGNGGKVTVTVLQGQRVHLFLNSDAASGFRSAPVYAVTVGERDIEVTISEKKGKHTDPDTPTQQRDADAKAEAAKAADTYTAPLTGDIWKKVSHKYTSEEVDGLMPVGTAPETIAAIKSIYNGLPATTLSVHIPAKGNQPAKTLKVKFEDSNNPKENICSYSLLVDGLPRVHPGGYAALMNAALDNNIPSLTVTSCWRPMLGSIAHRAGLGLDVNYVGNTQMNRQELRGGVDTANVSEAEKKAFTEYEHSILDAKRSRAEAAATHEALVSARKSGDAATTAEAKKRYDDAQDAARLAAATQAKSQKLWDKERDAAEPDKVKLFRSSLLRCSCVTQLFDPWFMDANTSDSLAPESNMQRGASTSNERLHSHHLHITVSEPKIL